jgi:hypothetical protein
LKTPFLSTADLKNFPLLPFFVLFLHSFAGKGGDDLVVYFFWVCFTHFDLAGIYTNIIIIYNAKEKK